MICLVNINAFWFLCQHVPGFYKKAADMNSKLRHLYASAVSALFLIHMHLAHKFPSIKLQVHYDRRVSSLVFKLKTKVIKFAANLQPEGAFSPAVQKEDKSDRGWAHVQIARQLCPRSDIERFDANPAK